MECSLLSGLSSHESCWETDVWTAVAAPIFWQHQRNKGFGKISWQTNKEDPETEPKAPAWGKNGALLYESIQGYSFKWSHTCHLVEESESIFEVAIVARSSSTLFQPQDTGHMISQPRPKKQLPLDAPSPWILKVSLPCSSQLPHRAREFGMHEHRSQPGTRVWAQLWKMKSDLSQLALHHLVYLEY